MDKTVINDCKRMLFELEARPASNGSLVFWGSL